MWSNGRCSLGVHCKVSHCFSESKDSEMNVSMTNSDLSYESPKKVISIDESLPRQRLDLFTHLDFSNELDIDGESILGMLSKELYGSSVELSIIADSDHSPWSLPN